MTSPRLASSTLLIDDFVNPDASRLGSAWRLTTDRVMGGVSQATLTRSLIEERHALCLQGRVSLENNGGFVQMNLDLNPDRMTPDTGLFDASAFTGIRLIVRGDGARYNLHLKTTATTLPWQSYRTSFATQPSWQEVRLPFSAFVPHRLVPTLDRSRLKRLGIVAIGEARTAEICLAEIGFY
jgi:hypothetical protein